MHCIALRAAHDAVVMVFTHASKQLLVVAAASLEPLANRDGGAGGCVLVSMEVLMPVCLCLCLYLCSKVGRESRPNTLAHDTGALAQV